LALDFVIYTVLALLSITNCFRRNILRGVRGQDSKDLNALIGRELVDEAARVKSEIRNPLPDTAILVSELQCWKPLKKVDIGSRGGHSEIVYQDNRKCGIYSVKGVSFRVKRGERFVILGSASSGRTSICQSITGIERVLSGEIYIEGLQTEQLFGGFSKMHGLVGY